MGFNIPFTTLDTRDPKLFDKLPKDFIEKNNLYDDWPMEWVEGDEDFDVTVDANGKVVEYWCRRSSGYPDWPHYLYYPGDDPGAIVRTREHPFRQPVKQGGYTKYFHENRGFFTEGGDAWHGLTRSPDMEIVIDEKGFMVDSWDSQTKKRYGTLGDEIGSRENTFEMPPDQKAVKDMTKAELEAAIKELGVDIAKESGTIAYDKYAAGYKKGRMSDLMKAHQKASKPPEKKYRRRYCTPRPYRYSPKTYYRLARDTFVLSPAITEGYIFKTYGWASGGGIPRD